MSCITDHSNTHEARKKMEGARSIEELTKHNTNPPFLPPPSLSLYTSHV